MRINAAIINAPNKSYLLNAGPQAAALKSLFIINKVDFAAMPEMYTGLFNAMNKQEGSRVIMPSPNNVMGNYFIGTGVYVNTRKWEVLDIHNIKLEWSARGGRGLNFPVVLASERTSGRRVVFVGTHLPTLGSSSPAIRERMNKAIRAYANQFDVPVIIAGDFNDGYVRDQYKGFALGAAQGIDQVLVDGLKPKRKKVIKKGIKGRITDHDAMVIARLASLPEPKPVRAKRLKGLIKGALRRRKKA